GSACPLRTAGIRNCPPDRPASITATATLQLASAGARPRAGVKNHAAFIAPQSWEFLGWSTGRYAAVHVVLDEYDQPHCVPGSDGPADARRRRVGGPHGCRRSDLGRPGAVLCLALHRRLNPEPAPARELTDASHKVHKSR